MTPLYPPEAAPFCPVHSTKRMIERKGPYGPFFGCSLYPDCKETISMDDFDHSQFA